MKHLRSMFAIAFLALYWVSCAHAQTDGGNWPRGSTLPVLEQPTWGDDDSHAWPRIPSTTETGQTCICKEWPPSVTDIPLYLWQKHKVGLWLKKNAVPMIEKYVPIISRWASNIEKARNAIIISTPIVLKALKKL